MSKSEAAVQILSYLLEHRDAQDTLEGIVDWWLLDRDIQREMALVKEALRELVAEGFLIETRNAGLRVRYHVNRSRLTEIEGVVERRKKPVKEPDRPLD